MDPFTRLVKTQQEKDELLRLARIEWDKLGELQPMVARSEEDFLGKISDGIIVEKEPFVAPRELTAAEKAAMDGRLMFSQIFGDRADSSDTGIPALDDLAKANEEASFRKLLEPGQRTRNQLDVMIEKALEQAIQKSAAVARRASEREGIMPRMAPVSEGASSMHRTTSGGRIEVNGNECTEYAIDGRFLRCWVGVPSDRPPLESLAT